MAVHKGSSSKGQASRGRANPYGDAAKAAAKHKYKSVHSEVKRAVSKTLGAEGPKKSMPRPSGVGKGGGKGVAANKPPKKRSK